MKNFGWENIIWPALLCFYIISQLISKFLFRKIDVSNIEETELGFNGNTNVITILQIGILLELLNVFNVKHIIPSNISWIIITLSVCHLAKAKPNLFFIKASKISIFILLTNTTLEYIDISEIMYTQFISIILLIINLYFFKYLYFGMKETSYTIELKNQAQRIWNYTKRIIYIGLAIGFLTAYLGIVGSGTFMLFIILGSYGAIFGLDIYLIYLRYLFLRDYQNQFVQTNPTTFVKLKNAHLYIVLSLLLMGGSFILLDKSLGYKSELDAYIYLVGGVEGDSNKSVLYFDKEDEGEFNYLEYQNGQSLNDSRKGVAFTDTSNIIKSNRQRYHIGINSDREQFFTCYQEEGIIDDDQQFQMTNRHMGCKKSIAASKFDTLDMFIYTESDSGSDYTRRDYVLKRQKIDTFEGKTSIFEVRSLYTNYGYYSSPEIIVRNPFTFNYLKHSKYKFIVHLVDETGEEIIYESTGDVALSKCINKNELEESFTPSIHKVISGYIEIELFNHQNESQYYEKTDLVVK